MDQVVKRCESLYAVPRVRRMLIGTLTDSRTTPPRQLDTWPSCEVDSHRYVIDGYPPAVISSTIVLV